MVIVYVAVVWMGCADQAAVPDTGPPQPDWGPFPPQWKALKLTTVDLYGVACIKGHVFIVGDKGTILHKSPGKSTFDEQIPPIVADLRSVSFAASAAGAIMGVAGGNHFDMVQTEDLGQKWTITPQCMKVPLDRFYSIQMYTPGSGIAVGYQHKEQHAGVKYSENGTWSCAPVFKGVFLLDVFRLGKDAWAVGKPGGKIYLGGNGGATWKTQALPVSEPLHGIVFAGKDLGLAVGDRGTILRSADGQGVAWSSVATPSSADLQDVAVWGDKLVWAVGDQGTVLHSGDGGKTWARQTTHQTVRLEGVCFTSAKDGWIVGAGGTVLFTGTGGN